MAKYDKKTATKTLVAFAAAEMGVDLSGLERAEVIAAIVAYDPTLFDDSINGGGSGTEPNADEPSVNLLGGGSGTEPKAKREPIAYTIEIAEQDEDGDEEDNFVQVGLNGVMNQVRKGVEVKVSQGIFDVLNNAIEINYKSKTDPITKLKTLEEKKTKRWPFSIIEKHYADEA
ncbi:hypothetical protein [Shewanella sp. T24-MNA-CIBAN-0130]|uniref:hypothetical protein n=1 Tax=Shewanella sp. T24-MNA-CIBAN-0130 TaxID=3140470 RepID=UPI0033227216